MRFILKLLLFPIVLAITLLVAVCRFVCGFAGSLSALLSFGILLVGIATIVLLQEPSDGIGIIMMAFLFSPYGIPALASWCVDRLDNLCNSIRSI